MRIESEMTDFTATIQRAIFVRLRERFHTQCQTGCKHLGMCACQILDAMNDDQKGVKP